MLLFYVINVKAIMNALLKSELFDDYEARGVTLQTFTRFDVSCEADGVSEKKYCSWGEIRVAIFELIKGKNPPRILKIGLCLTGDAASEIDQNAAALHMTLIYENGQLSVLTGSSQKSFVLDKSVDKAWDSFVMSLFAKNRFEIRESTE